MGLCTGMYCTQGIVCTQVSACKSHAPAVALIAGLNRCFISSSPSPPSFALSFLFKVAPICHHSFSLTSFFVFQPLFPPPLCIQLCPRQSHFARQKRRSRGMGTGSWAVLVVLKDVWVAAIRREDPMSVLVRVTLINHILSAGCAED